MNNSLLTEFKTPFNTVPFQEIKQDDFLPAVKEVIHRTKMQIERIATNSDAPVFENTIEELEYASLGLDRITGIFFNLNSAETSPEMQLLAQEISPLVTSFHNDVMLNDALFQKVKAVYDKKEDFSLNKEQQTLLEKTYQSFVRNGARLKESDQSELRSIDNELAKLSLTFNENVLAETQDFILHLTDKSALSGLPETTIESAKEEAENRNLEGWVFTLDYPSYIPFMTYADNRDLRKKMSVAFGAKAFRGNNNDNTEIVKRIVELRLKRAQLLGYITHSDYVLEERMAEKPEKVIDFLSDLLEKALPAAKKEFEELSKFALSKDGIESLEKWDGAYYSEKLKHSLFDLEEEKLKPYFSLNNVIQGAFEIAHRLFNLNFSEVTTIQKYHEDVKTYEVRDDQNQLVAIFYADFHPRKGKRAGAWMTSFQPQYKQKDINQRPHVAIVCNFSKPTSSKPSLLSFNEVTTLFHEFGHALHGMLADTTYPSMSGTSVYWDFVELPSQLMENWCYEPDALALFAKHYETGEVIPMDYISKIKKSANFLEGLATIRQISFGLLDMAFHATKDVSIDSLKEFEKKVMEPASLYPDVKENMMSTQFSHIFAGGYSSGYYSYKWAEVLDADAFEYFREKGIFNVTVAEKFKSEILSKGGTVHPMELFINFRGKEPSIEPLLKRAGLIS